MLVATKKSFLLFFLFFPFSVVTISQRMSARIKKLIKQKLTLAPKETGVDTFPDPIGHFVAPSDHFGFCKWCGIAGGKRVPPAPLGWYSRKLILLKRSFKGFFTQNLAMADLGIF